MANARILGAFDRLQSLTGKRAFIESVEQDFGKGQGVAKVYDLGDFQQIKARLETEYRRAEMEQRRGRRWCVVRRAAPRPARHRVAGGNAACERCCEPLHHAVDRCSLWEQRHHERARQSTTILGVPMQPHVNSITATALVPRPQISSRNSLPGGFCLPPWGLGATVFRPSVAPALQPKMLTHKAKSETATVQHCNSTCPIRARARIGIDMFHCCSVSYCDYCFSINELSRNAGATLGTRGVALRPAE